MNPQGSSIINLSQYDKLTDRVKAASGCEELQKISTEILASLNAENDAITAQLDKLAPIAALLSPPSTPDDIIDWITGLIDGVLRPLYAPALTYPAQVTARTAKIAELVNEINNKSNEFTNCSITLPT